MNPRGIARDMRRDVFCLLLPGPAFRLVKSETP